MSKEQKQQTVADDVSLLEGIKRGNSDTLKILYKQFYPMALRFVTHNSGSEDDAKDIFQEAVIALYDRIGQQKLDLKCQLKTFIYSICRNLWLKRLGKKDRYSLNIEDFEDSIPLVNEIEWMEERDKQFFMMEAAMKRLGEPCQSILKDFYIYNMSMQDISDKFGYTSTDNAKTQKYKCLQRLKKLFFN
ncbi:RNA polymerase sigma factor [Olivibacter sitiensis]|uniref:RNA polymerase sigma factor n=1 Tax=Olivibacter sitiensis TaxID=376470 RepID=UPI00041BF42F|nr:sigma-70 family RNA polymerase sigma factor [Olivibacter sitiensis]